MTKGLSRERIVAAALDQRDALGTEIQRRVSAAGAERSALIDHGLDVLVMELGGTMGPVAEGLQGATDRGHHDVHRNQVFRR